jgi:hypothetical protein
MTTTDVLRTPSSSYAPEHLFGPYNQFFDFATDNGKVFLLYESRGSDAGTSGVAWIPENGYDGGQTSFDAGAHLLWEQPVPGLSGVTAGADLSVVSAGEGLLACPPEGCGGSPTALIPPEALQIFSPRIAGSQVVWAEGSSVRTCTLPNCSPSSLSDSERNPFVVRATNSVAVWVDGPLVRSCALPSCGGTPTTIATAPPQRAYSDLVIDKKGVYLIDGGTAGANFADGEVVLVPAGSSTAHVLASGLQMPISVAVDESWVYYYESTSGFLSKVPK